MRGAMKCLAFSCWPVLRRIRNEHVRRLVGFAGLAVAFCLVWFFTNRVLSPFRAIRIEGAAADRAPVTSFKGRLCIATFNIAHGRGIAESNWQTGRHDAKRLKEIAALLKDEKADIVVLNEVDFDASWSGGVNQARYIAEEGGFPFRVEQVNCDIAAPGFSLRWGNAVLSKYPVRKARLVDFPPYSDWEWFLAGHKRGVLCEIQLDEALIVRVLGVHLDTRSELTRLQAAEQIEETRAESKTPFILAGDMNTGPIGFPAVKPTSDGRTAVSYLLARGAYHTVPLNEPGPADYTYPAANPAKVIDWILVSREWKIIARTVSTRVFSDHNAVLMEIQFGIPMTRQ